MDYNMSGPALGSPFMAGLKAGVQDATSTIQTSMNNQYLAEAVVMFIGLCAIVGLIMFIFRRHRGSQSLGGGRGWDGKMYAGSVSLADYERIRSAEQSKGWDSPAALEARRKYGNN